MKLEGAHDYGTQNNGQIQAVHYYLSPGVEDATASEYFSYDAWGRLKAGHTGIVDARIWTWSLQWDYDRFGNRRNQTLIGGGAAITQPQLTISETTNRITDAGYAYDAAGNMTNDSLHSYSYDAENRTKTVDSTGATYSYVGALRVKKVVGATTTVYVFSGSKLIAEYASGALLKEYVYAGSTLLTTLAADGTPTYHHPDHLSDRAQTDSAGGLLWWQGHYPFGETWYESAPSGKWQFTSYERDSESGVDYADFRNYTSRLGRFLQADPLAGGVFEPQSMNRYAYVNNEPINLVDPLGLDPKKNIPVSNDPFGDAGWTSLTIIVTYGWIPWDGSVSLPGINNPQAGAITGLAYWGITGYSGIGSFYGGGLMGGAAGGGGGGGGNSKDPTKLPKCSDVFWDALKQPVALVNKGMKMLPVVVPALAGAGWGARWIAAQAWAMEAAGRVDPIGGAAYWQGIAESSDALAAGGRAALLRAPTFALGALDAALAYAVAKEAYAAATGQCKR